MMQPTVSLQHDDSLSEKDSKAVAGMTEIQQKFICFLI